MSFDDLRAEIAAEFHELAGGVFWEMAAERAHRENKVKLSDWAARGKWWAKTTAGKRYDRERKKARNAFLRTVVIGTGQCIVCGGSFDRRPTDWKGKRTCSRPCAGTLRSASSAHYVTIDGLTKSVAAWCRHLGISQSHVCVRRRKGMSAFDALTTPVKRYNRKTKARS